MLNRETNLAERHEELSVVSALYQVVARFGGEARRGLIQSFSQLAGENAGPGC